MTRRCVPRRRRGGVSSAVVQFGVTIHHARARARRTRCPSTKPITHGLKHQQDALRDEERGVQAEEDERVLARDVVVVHVEDDETREET